MSTSSLARSDLGPPTHSISDNSCLPCVAPVADRQMSSAVGSEESEAPGTVSARDWDARPTTHNAGIAAYTRICQARSAPSSAGSGGIVLPLQRWPTTLFQGEELRSSPKGAFGRERCHRPEKPAGGARGRDLGVTADERSRATVVQATRTTTKD